MMAETVSARANTELRELAVEGSLALARLDGDRLEELALSCRDLYLDFREAGNAERGEWARQARDARGEMAVYGRVLEATRANLEVVKRLRERQAARLEYVGLRGSWALAEKCDGND